MKLLCARSTAISSSKRFPSPLHAVGEHATCTPGSFPYGGVIRPSVCLGLRTGAPALSRTTCRKSDCSENAKMNSSKKSSASQSRSSSAGPGAVDVGVPSFGFGRCRTCAFGTVASLLVSRHVASAFSVAPRPSRRNHLVQSRGSHSSSSGDFMERRRGLFGQSEAMFQDHQGSRRGRAPLRNTATPREPPSAMVDDGATLGQQVGGGTTL